MRKAELRPGFTHQAYRFEVDRPGRHPAIPSHTGAKRFAWNFMLGIVEEQLHAKETFRILALRQGASMQEAQRWAEQACTIPYLVEMNEKRQKEHEAKVASGQRKPGEYQAVSEWFPRGKEAMRFVWNRIKDDVAPWWAENSKECYSGAFEALDQAFSNYFDSRDATRKGASVGWPRYKSRRGRQSATFTTGALELCDRHHVQLPVIGVLRVKEPTDKLRLRLEAGTARILRATLGTDGGKAFVSFTVESKREQPISSPMGVCGHDVGIAALVTSSDGKVVENPRAGERARKKISRYQRRMDRQHKAASPRCFDWQGRHIVGACYWVRDQRSKRARENERRLQKAHARAARIRKDAIHKASHHAATTYAVNIVEDLRVAAMGRRGHGERGFNRAQHDAALAELRRELSYKHLWYGGLLWLAAWWYPSSKICSRCRTKKDKLSRSARVFCCESCGLVIDRDLNAAKNLAALAELACVCIIAQLATGTPVDWSKLPVRPYGWEPDQSTRSSRGCARAGGRKAKGGAGKTARPRAPQGANYGDAAFDREAAKPPVPLVGAHQSKVA